MSDRPSVIEDPEGFARALADTYLDVGVLTVADGSDVESVRQLFVDAIVRDDVSGWDDDRGSRLVLGGLLHDAQSSREGQDPFDTWDEIRADIARGKEEQ